MPTPAPLVDPPIETVATILANVQNGITAVNNFKNEQVAFFTTTNSTTTVTDESGNAATVVSYNEIKQNFVKPSLTSMSVTTPTTSQYTGTITLAALGILTSISTTASCRVRLYPTSAQRAFDLARSSSTPVNPGIGLLFEGITTNNMLTYVVGANPFLYNGDSPQTTNIYYTIEPTTLGSVEVTFNYYPLAWSTL